MRARPATRAKSAARTGERLLDALPLAFALFDAKGALLDWNTQLVEVKLFPKRLLRAGTPIQEFRAHDEQLSGRVAKPRELRCASGAILRVTAKRLAGKQLLVTYEDVTEARNTAERFELVERSVSEGIYDHDMVADRVTYSERTFRASRARYGRSVLRSGMTGREYVAFIHPEDRDRYRAELRAHFKGGGDRFECEYRLGTGGRYRWFRQHGTSVRDARGRVVRMIGATADITDRKEAELALERSHAETAEALERQTATAEILKVIASSPDDVTPVLQAIADSASRLVSESAAAVTRIEAGMILFGASSIRDPAARNQVRQRYPHPVSDNPIACQIRDTPESVQVADTERTDDKGLRSFARARGFRSLLVTPLIREGEVIGSVNVVRSEPGAFTEHQVALLKTFADQAVIAIENVRLFNETKEALAEQQASGGVLAAIAGSMSDTAPVFERILEACEQLFDGYFAGISVLGDDGLIHLAGFRGPNREGFARVYPVPNSRESAAGTVIATGRVLHYPDTEAPDVHETVRMGGRAVGARSLIMAPMLTDKGGIGSIFVARREPAPFSAREIARLEAFANQATIAVKNARLFNETKEALEHQTAAAEVLQVISSSVADTAPVFEKIIRSCEKLFGVRWANVALMREDGMIHLVQDFGSDDLDDEEIAIREHVQAQFPRPVRESIHGYAMHKGEVLHFADMVNDPDLPKGLREYNRRVAAELGVTRKSSAMFAPMIWEGRGVGAIAVHRTPAAPFSEREIRLFKTFADQAAIAIQNARLFNETKETLERQTATAEILKVIADSPTDVQPVFDAIAQSAANVFRCNAGVNFIDQDDRIHLRALAGPDLTAERTERMFRIFPIPLEGTIVEQAVRAQTLVEVPDTEAETVPEKMRALGRAGEFRSMTIAPLLREGKGIGAIGLTNFDLGFRLDDKQKALLQTFADQAVIAIENARLFNETKEALERQTATAEILKVIADSPTDVQPVFDAIVRSASRIFQCNAGINIVEDGWTHLKAITGPDATAERVEKMRSLFPIRVDEAGFTVAVLRSGSIREIPDTEAEDVPEGVKEVARAGEYRSLVLAPMAREGKGIGTIGLTNWKLGFRLDDKQKALLQTFADQAVIAIENVRLFRELEARNREVTESLERQTATSDVLQTIGRSISDAAPVFERILDSTERLIACRNTAIFLYPINGQVHCVAVRGPGAAGVAALYPAPLDEKSLSHAMTVTRRQVTYSSIQHDPDVPPLLREIARRTGDHSIAATPLLWEGGVIGHLSVVREPGATFDDKELGLLRTFASQAVIAIQNARLFNETKEALEHQTATAEILKVIASSPDDVQPVLDAIAETAKRLFEDNDVGVALIRNGQVELAAVASPDAQMVRGLRSTFPRPLDLDSSVNRTVVHGETVHHPDMSAVDLPAYTRNVGVVARLGAMLGVPLMREGKSIGGLFLSKPSAGAYTDKQQALLRTFADQAVIAIENVRLFNETREALERQTATAEILKVISASPTDTQPVFDAIAQNAIRLVRGHSSSVTRVVEDRLHLVALTSTDSSGDAMVRASYPMSLDQGTPMADAVRAGRTVLVRDTETDPGFAGRGRQVARSRGFRSIAYVPMRREQSVLGVIHIAGVGPSSITDAHVGLLESFADQAVIAIENVRLFNETKEALERQTATAEILKVISESPTDVQPTFDAIVTSATRLFGWNAGMFMLEGDWLHLNAVAGDAAQPERIEALHKFYPIQMGPDLLAYRAIESRSIVEVPDTEAVEASERIRALTRALGTRSAAVVPLVRDGKGIGVLALSHSAPGRRLSDKQRALLQTFVDQAVIAIENVRLFNELEARNREVSDALERQTATAEILKVISSSPGELQPVLDAIVTTAQRLVAPAAVGFSLRDGDMLQYGGMRDGSGEVPSLDSVVATYYPIPRDPSASAAWRAILDRRVIEIPDVTAEGVPERTRRLFTATGMRSNIQIPLLREGEGIGALGVAHPQPGFRLSPNQLELMQTFADQAVIAIENVRLFNETKEALERQTATGEILKIISESPTDTRPVFYGICRSAARLFGSYASITMIRGDQIDIAAMARPDGPVEWMDLDGMAVAAKHNRTDAELEQIRASIRRNYPHRFDPEKNLSERAIEAGEILVVPDTEAPEVAEYLKDMSRNLGFRSLTMVPLLREGRGIGAISLSFPEPGRVLDDKQRALVQTFADQAVIAIENVRLFNETKEALEHQTATTEVLQVISGSIADATPVFDEILERCMRLFSGSITSLGLVGDDGMVRMHLAEPHLDRTMNAAEKRARDAVLGSYPRPSRDSIYGYVAHKAQTLYFSDVQNGPGVPQGLRASVALTGANYSVVYTPLMWEGRGIGALSVAYIPVRPFSEKEIKLLKTFADQAVIAIQNARLFSETKEALERQTATAEILKVISESPTDVQPVFDAITRSAARLVGARVGIIIRDGDSIDFKAAAAVDLNAQEIDRALAELKRPYPMPFDPETSVSAKVMATLEAIEFADTEADGVPVFIRDTARRAGHRAICIVPLIREGVGIGSLSVASAQSGARLNDHQHALLRTFADQAVIAIENVRLFNETKEALERQTATAEILKVISESPTDVQPVFDAIAQSAARLFGCSCALQMRQGEKIELCGLAGPAATPERAAAARAIWPLPFDPSQNLVSRVIAERKLIEIPDTETEDLPPEFKAVVRAIKFRSVTQIPLMREGQAIGTVGLFQEEPGLKLDEKQRALLRTFADQAVIAIENVRLFNELQDRTAALTKSVGQLTALGEVSQTLSSTLDLDKVLATIVSRAVQLTGLDGGAIYEYDEAQGIFLLRGGENLREEVVELNRTEPIRMGDGFIGQAAQTRSPVQVPDLAAAPQRTRGRDVLLGIGFRALLAVPLVREGHVLGALAVARNTTGEFAPEVIALLQTFATQSAIAIQNARLFREIEAKSRQLEEASQHKSQFLASMSHELRTPLNAILGFNEMILAEIYGEVPENMKAPLEQTQSSGKHLLGLINNVLDLAKIEANRMELALADYAVQDLVATARATLAPLAESKGLAFEASAPDDLPLGYGDSGRLAQCLINLAGNAIKFTKEGSVRIAVEAAGEQLRFSVADTGMGIAPDKIAELFTEFKQTDATIAREYGGTGLGLAITKKFIELHGGTIRVESTLGQGSDFIFEIPLRAQPS